MGHMIPAGTGNAEPYARLKITLPFGADLPVEDQRPPEAS